jgi:hypothetical protein
MNIKIFRKNSICIKILLQYICIFFIIISYFYITNDVFLCDDIPYNDGSSQRPDLQGNYNREDSNYPLYNREGNRIYQPYREGLHNTSQGFRYELPDNCINKQTFAVELDGKPVYAKYLGIDIQGNPLYTCYSDGSCSTQLGIIEPTRSEVIGNGYYIGTGSE